MACNSQQAAQNVTTQWAPDSATVRLAAGPEYDRGGVWRFFWGTHYRNVWATPVTVPVLNLATAVPGGLVPIKAGGSYQSRTLRLGADNGDEFVLRSVDKDASAALPEGWVRGLLGGLMKDQTSAANPYGAYVAARLAESAGVYHTNPRLVYVPDDPGLGKYRKGYGNALYLLEERPQGNQSAVASFGRSIAVINTEKMLTEIRKSPGAVVDARAYLRARLLDIWLGDWSRREDQWRWASFQTKGHVVFRPIPRDRDQAFFLFNDGVVTRLVSWFVPKYRSFGPGLPVSGVQGLTTTARTLDRTLLAALSAEDFQEVADSLRQRLTDAAISHALQAGPQETQALLANQLGPVLRKRRERLPAAAARFYKILAAEAWLVGTDKPERFALRFLEGGRLRVSVSALRPGQPDSLLSKRVYDRKDTYKLSVFGLGGDDVFELQGAGGSGPAVHLYDGAGQDEVVRSAPESRSGVTWHRAPDGNRETNLTGIKLKPDTAPAETANYQGWLKRYNLDD
ncbi:hypothetical protein [Hymenobacter sp. IS2118]|uniref:hypothetical protein n=1 Tax=Hymenobacter sp. IS2118 TaxID=1505605 RepID=UPI0005558BA5|nr:hypothetical protein [Hymenobacter sp. IS2118]